MKTAYFNCFAGAAGDMIAASMIDAGLSADLLRNKLNSLGIEGLIIEITSTSQCGIEAVNFRPIAPEQKNHRNIKDITELIEKSNLATDVKNRAIEIFRTLAEAEAKVHNTTPEEVHFHEVGAVDSIVDVLSACIGFEALGIEKVYCSVISVGSGTVKCDHGIMPVPAPATIEIVKRFNVPIQSGPGELELLTPTAAAILTEFASQFGPMPPIQIETVGYGAGTYQSDKFANVLQLFIGESVISEKETDYVYLIETNIDDATGEMIGFAVDGLLNLSALDVFTEPIQMKHNRPAVRLSILCKTQDINTMEDFLFSQGLTLGIRKQLIQRSKLQREFMTVKTCYGDINVKTGIFKGRQVLAKPEYSDCAAIAKEENIPLKAVMKEAMSSYRSKTANNNRQKI